MPAGCWGGGFPACPAAPRNYLNRLIDPLQLTMHVRFPFPSKVSITITRCLSVLPLGHPWSFVALLAQLEPAQMHNMTSQPVDHLALSIPTFTISSNPSPIQIYIESLLCTGIAYPCQDLGVSITHFNCVVHSGLSQTWQSKPMAELFGYPAPARGFYCLG